MATPIHFLTVGDGAWPDYIPGSAHGLIHHLRTKGTHEELDATVRLKIVHDLIDAFNDMVTSVVSAHPNTHYVNLRETLTTQAQWHNELHPRKAGFKLVTDEIEAKIRAVV